MDFSHPAYFGAGQPYQFVGIPPPTPSHSNSAASDDFNTTSPPEVFDQFPNGLPQDQFQTFDTFAQYGQHQGFPDPPTPPNQHTGRHGQPQLSQGMNGGADGLSLPKTETLEDLAQSRRQGSNSDDEDLTPAQSRRKAQNRAAQRAFRERKERHVKDLEAKLASIEAAQHETSTENEQLKRDLQKISTENEILRATSSIQGATSPGSNGTAPITTGPMSYNPTNFYSNVLQNHDNKTPSHRVVTSDSGERLLAAGATWDMIVGHDLFKRGLVDVSEVSERLKHQAKCDGQGPVFEERAILEAIEQSAAGGSDELL